MNEARNAHWIVKALVDIARQQGWGSLEDLSLEANLGRNTVYWMARGVTSSPTVGSVESIAEVLGYELELMPNEQLVQNMEGANDDQDAQRAG